MEERRENGNTRHHEPTYLLANARVANGRRWRKQGASRTKREEEAAENGGKQDFGKYTRKKV